MTWLIIYVVCGSVLSNAVMLWITKRLLDRLDDDSRVDAHEYAR